MQHLLTLADLTAAEIERIFSITEDLKSKYRKGLREPLLPGRMMALLFGEIHRRQQSDYRAMGAIHQQLPLQAGLHRGGALDGQLHADHYPADADVADQTALLLELLQTLAKDLAEPLHVRQ